MNFVPFSTTHLQLKPLCPPQAVRIIAVRMLSSSVAVATEEVGQHHMILDWPSHFKSNCHSKISNLFECC